MIRTSFLLTLFLVTFWANAQNHHPSFEEVISLKIPYGIQLSPDGRHIAFQVRGTEWKNNRFDTEIYLSRDGQQPYALTNNTDGSSTSPQWSPDGRWLSYLSSQEGKTQVYVMPSEGGAAFPVTQSSEGVSSYQWSPDSKQIAFTQSQGKDEKERKEKFGEYAVEDEEYTLQGLYLIDFRPELLGAYPLPDDSTQTNEPRPLIDSVNFTVSGIRWSPDSRKIAFNKRPNPLINTFFEMDIAVYNLADSSYRVIVANSSSDRFLDWSPDSEQIIYESDVENTTSNYYTNNRLFIARADGSKIKEVAEQFDENLYGVTWNDAGMFASAFQQTNRQLVEINPRNGKVSAVLTNPARIRDWSFSARGDQLAFIAEDGDRLREIYRTPFPVRAQNVQQVTNFSGQIKDWKVSDSEVISWASKDGTTIEGVLHKPQDYDPDQQYPLLVVIHGGPTGISVPDPVPSYVYPIVQWLNKGALILQPNYRGSAGYGADFRKLNVRNLGVGDAWDVESGVDYLVEQGRVDAEKVGAMGWSQGGYISAFLATHSAKFQAISVGAGISNWMTYYVNTDIHPFTRQYLQATPWEDEAIYQKTSPMSNINDATTPTLIQHGEFDKRVPPANAYELYQGLQDVGVESKLIIYKGFGHGITKPKERLAAMWHNWEWFNEHIWGEEVELPVE